MGYFPAPPEAIAEAIQNWERATGLAPTTIDDLQPVAGEALLSGSSTVAPISEAMAAAFAGAGFPVEISVEVGGTGAGFESYCLQESADIVDASRPIQQGEDSACRSNGLAPIAFPIGKDGVAVVVSQQNDFVDALTTEQLAQVFIAAETWSDVNPEWPDTPILRFIPGEESGTLDVFVAALFGTDLAAMPEETLISLLETHLSPGLIRRLDSERGLRCRHHRVR